MFKILVLLPWASASIFTFNNRGLAARFLPAPRGVLGTKNAEPASPPGVRMCLKRTPPGGAFWKWARVRWERGAMG